MDKFLELLLEDNFQRIKLSKSNINREVSFYNKGDFIRVVIGMRRTGKTNFLYQKVNELLDTDVLAEQIFFINFEDERLLNIDAQGMGRLIDEFYRLYPDNHNRKTYLFLDEVQNVENWHATVRRFFDTKDCEIYLSGSSAKLLSTEIHTSLRGRSLATEIWSFSFNEYCTFHNIQRPSKFSSATYDQLLRKLSEYLQSGGFPAVQNMEAAACSDMIRSYVDTVILRDIVERHKISNVNALKLLVNTLLKNAGSLLSVNKIYNSLKSQGIKIGKESLYEYVTYIEDAYLAFSVPYYAESDRKRMTLPKKVYANDNSLIILNSLFTNEMLGKLFENLIYLDLRREGKSVYYYTTQSGFEIDFVTIDKKQQREIIQVCWEMEDDETRTREERAIAEASEELGIKGRIITPWEYLKGAF